MPEKMKRVDLRDLFWTRATEAPNPNDLTASTDDAMKRASGNNADRGDFDPGRTSDQTNQEDANDTQGEAGMGDIDSVEPDTPGENPEGDDMGGDDIGGGGDDFGGDMGGDDPNAGGDTGMGDDQTPNETPEQSKQIFYLQKKMNQFYQVLKNTCESLTDYSAPSSNDDLLRVYNQAVGHLSSARDMLYDLLTSPFTSANYADKLRKYVALRHVYSTILNVLDIHFNILDQMTQTKQSSK